MKSSMREAGVSVGDGCEGFAQVGIGIDGVELAGLDERGHACPGAAALPWPAKSAFFRFRVIGRIVFSTELVSISSRPSVRKTTAA